MNEDDDLRTRLRTAASEYHHLRVNLENARDTLRPLIVEALKRSDLKQKDVIADSGLTREYIRRIARNEGIEAAD